MSEILLQAIVEKLEVLEIALLKQGSASRDEETLNDLTTAVKSVQSELIRFGSNFTAHNEKINKLYDGINVLRFKSGNLIQNKVKHTHHFHKQVWLTVSLFIISLLLTYGWINCNNEKKSFEENDIKYRFWKANGGTALLKLLFQTDSLYNLNKDSFAKQVFEREKNLAEQAEEFRFADEKKKEARSSKAR